MTDDERELLVVYKPDGVDGLCTAGEVSRVLAAWASVLRWLRGEDPDELPEPELMGLVARKAALRMPRFADYDLRQWAAQAHSLGQSSQLSTSGDQPLPALACVLLARLGLRRNSARHCWLNRVAIELLYREARSFQRNRDMLVPRLLDGPALIERWTGERYELALAAKLLLRRALDTKAVTNLVHMEIAGHREVHIIWSKPSKCRSVDGAVKSRQSIRHRFPFTIVDLRIVGGWLPRLRPSLVSRP